MATLSVYNLAKEQVSSMEVSDAIFATEVKQHLFYEVIKWQLAKRRSGTAATKGRNDVSGGGKKPFRQKGTGRARQGSTRAPQWVGGGTVHGPQPRSYAYNINKKLRRAALRSAFSLRAQQNCLIVVKDLGMDEIKTKAAAGIFNGLTPDARTSKKRTNSGHALILGNGAHSERFSNLLLSVRNLPKVDYLPVDGINLYDILNHRYLVLSEPVVRRIEEVLA